MFRRRIKWFWILLTAVTVIIVARLVEMQVVRADEYQALANRLLMRPVRYLRPPRGSILDRRGTPLVSDEPASDISVHYAVLTGQEDHLRTVARELCKPGGPAAAKSTAEVVAELREEIPGLYRRLSELTGQPLAEFAKRAEETSRRVERVRAVVARHAGHDQPVAEEYELHPLIEGVDNDLALAVRMELEKYSWLKQPLLRVVPSSRWVAHDVDACVHVLGRLGAVSRERIEQDPLAGDDLRRLRPGDQCGISGVERLAETVLRGTRGRVVDDFDGTTLEYREPERGSDIYLTIDADLQRRTLAVLDEAVNSSVNPAGGSAVVIDVATREVLVLASYPAYEYDRYSANYERLRRDTRWTPLRFRAVSGQYPPGSTCKAITLIGGLSEGVINEHERIHCTGHLLPDKPDSFRCWIYNQYGVTHDSRDPAGQNAELAIRNSCNIYFYKVGDRLGPARLCEWFSRFGFGRLQGTGLIEESRGIVPTEEWLKQSRGREYQAADAWNFAIGQGEVTATPLQTANVAASVASGCWEPVHLARTADGDYLGPAADAPIEFDEQALRILRAGMWRVVNEPGGTGQHARLDRRDYELCGKTGSAQAIPRVVTSRFTFEWPDGTREVVIAPTKEDARATFADEQPTLVGRHAAARFPESLAGEKLPAHAWFIGYTQSTETRRGAAPQRGAYAISVIIEFGASGGRVAGPVAKQIAELVLERMPAE
ncbi:MAG: hypothetical protein KKB50_11340 [Planctomycetes bacterium]|nr:hypothetical protein [Planctomycetota bacterium]